MRSILALLLSLVLSGLAAAATLEEDVQRLVEIFRGDPSQHVQAVRSLAWMGISDPRVYDVIVQRLKVDADASRDDRDTRERVAHYLRAFGFSGNDKYLPILNSLQNDAEYSGHARKALQELPVYKRWNPVISNRATFFDLSFSDDVNRVMNMLAADDILLKGVGARRVRHGPYHEPPLLDRLAKDVRTLYPKAKDFDRETQDAVGWMLVGLGSSRDPKYLPVLEEVLNGTIEPKLRRAVTSALRFYGAEGQRVLMKFYNG
jgi:hypothetical protein